MTNYYCIECDPEDMKEGTSWQFCFSVLGLLTIGISVVAHGILLELAARVTPLLCPQPVFASVKVVALHTSWSYV
jgi:hypothetical protein